MAKLQALQAIEALTPDKLAEALNNNGYPQCRQLIIDKGINGAAFMNLTEMRLKQYQIYLKPSDIHRIWSLILRTKEHPEDFVLPNTDTRPLKKRLPLNPVKPENRRTSLTQALRDRVAHQAVCVQESSDEDTPDIHESEWSDEEKMPPQTPKVNEEKKESKKDVQEFKVNNESKKMTFNENRERIKKLFQEQGKSEVEIREETIHAPPPVPAKNKEPIYVNIQEMKEDAEKKLLPPPPKIDSPPKPPRPNKLDKKPDAEKNLVPPPPKIDSPPKPPRPNKQDKKPDATPLKIEKMILQPDKMPVRPDIIAPEKDKRPSKAEVMPLKPNLFSKQDMKPSKPDIMPSKADDTFNNPFKSNKIPPKPFRPGNIVPNFETLPHVSKKNNNKIGTLRIPPGLDKLFGASQTSNIKTVEPEFPRPPRPMQKQAPYDDTPVNVYDEIPDIDTPPPTPPPSMLSLPSDDSAVIRKSPSPKPEPFGFRLPPLPKQEELSALRLPPPPPKILRPPPIPLTPQRSQLKAEGEDNYESAPTIRFNENANFGPPLPRRPQNARNSTDDEDEEGYLINSDFIGSKESLNGNQERPLPAVPSENGGAAAAAGGPLEQNMYYRNLERIPAEKLLALQPVGSFLIRPSKKYFATLVIKSKQRICNVPIVHDGSQYYLLMDTNFMDQALMFTSLDSLIIHYTMHKVPLKDNSLCLRKNYNLPR